MTVLGLGAQLSCPHLGWAIHGRRRVCVRIRRWRSVVLLLLRQLRVPCNLRRGCGLLLRLVSRALAAGGGAHTPARTALCRVRFLGRCARFPKAGTQHLSCLPHCALSPGSCEGVALRALSWQASKGGSSTFAAAANSKAHLEGGARAKGQGLRHHRVPLGRQIADEASQEQAYGE